MNLRKFLLCGASLLLFPGCSKQDNVSDNKTSEKLIRDVLDKILEEEPEKFLSAIDKAMQKQQQQNARKIEAKATEEQKNLFGSKLVLGNPEAPIKVAIFVDPRDPISQKFISDVAVPVIQSRQDVCFHLIVVSIYGPPENESAPSSLKESQLILAAAMQDPAAALKLLSKIPDINKAFSKTVFLKNASDFGLDSTRLETDANSAEIHKQLVDNGQQAVTIGIPLQLPVIFIRNLDGNLSMIPPFIPEKFNAVVDVVIEGKPWEEALIRASNMPKLSNLGTDGAKQDETSNVQPKQKTN